MACKEQCELCCKYKKGVYGMKCSWFGKKPSFDNSECIHFEKKNISENKSRFEKGKEKEQQPFTSVDDAYEYILMSLKDRKAPTSQVVKELVQRGLPEKESEALVLKTAKELNEKALVPIFMSIMAFIGAIVLAADSITELGIRIYRIKLFFGLLILGIGLFVLGLSRRCKIE